MPDDITPERLAEAKIAFRRAMMAGVLSDRPHIDMRTGAALQVAGLLQDAEQTDVPTSLCEILQEHDDPRRVDVGPGPLLFIVLFCPGQVSRRHFRLVQIAGVIGEVITQEGLVYCLYHCIKPKVGIVNPQVNESGAGSGNIHLLKQFVRQNLPYQSGVTETIIKAKLLYSVQTAGGVKEIQVNLKTIPYRRTLSRYGI